MPSVPTPKSVRTAVSKVKTSLVEVVLSAILFSVGGVKAGTESCQTTYSQLWHTAMLYIFYVCRLDFSYLSTGKLPHYCRHTTLTAPVFDTPLLFFFSLESDEVFFLSLLFLILYDDMNASIVHVLYFSCLGTPTLNTEIVSCTAC